MTFAARRQKLTPDAKSGQHATGDLEQDWTRLHIVISPQIHDTTFSLVQNGHDVCVVWYTTRLDGNLPCDFWRQATKVDNLQPAIWNNIGLLYMSLDKFDGAKAVLQVSLFPSSMPPHLPGNASC